MRTWKRLLFFCAAFSVLFAQTEGNIPITNMPDFTDAGVSALMNESSANLTVQAVYMSCVQNPLAGAIMDSTFYYRTPELGKISPQQCNNEAAKVTWTFTESQKEAWNNTSTAVKDKFFQAMLTCRTSYLSSNGSVRAQFVGIGSNDPAIADGYEDVLVIQPTPERPTVITVVVVP